MRIATRSLLVALALSFLAAPVWAVNENADLQESLSLTPDIRHGREVYDVCRSCHLNEGWGSSDGTFPQIAGQLRSVLIKQLLDIRLGNRDNPMMYPFAQPEAIGGPQSLADVAAYIAQLPMNPRNGVGPGNGLDKGRQNYARFCAACHGVSGEGNSESMYPRLQGQHYRYMVRQVEWIRDGKRRNSDPAMVAVINQLDADEIREVLDYLSRLAPPQHDIAPDINWKNPDFQP